MIMKTNAIRSFLFLPQMANLAQRAGLLAQKQYLIIHPTADGNGACSSLSVEVISPPSLQWWRNPPISLPHPRKGSLPAHSQVYQPSDQRERQLHATGRVEPWTLQTMNCHWTFFYSLQCFKVVLMIYLSYLSWHFKHSANWYLLKLTVTVDSSCQYCLIRFSQLLLIHPVNTPLCREKLPLFCLLITSFISYWLKKYWLSLLCKYIYLSPAEPQKGIFKLLEMLGYIIPV